MKTNELSSCCSAAIKTSCADEGTCCYMCKKCENACDALVSWQKEAKLLYQLMIGQLEDVSFNQFFEFIRRMRQEASKQGYIRGGDDTVNTFKNKEKQAVKEFAEELKDRFKNATEFKWRIRKETVSEEDFNKLIDKALEVYEEK